MRVGVKKVTLESLKPFDSSPLSNLELKIVEHDTVVGRLTALEAKLDQLLTQQKGRTILLGLASLSAIKVRISSPGLAASV